jgi:hypothetical protein
MHTDNPRLVHAYIFDTIRGTTHITTPFVSNATVYANMLTSYPGVLELLELRVQPPASAECPLRFDLGQQCLTLGRFGLGQFGFGQFGW